MTQALDNERDLLKQFAKGDESAFRQLFDLYKERLYSFVFYLTHSRADAEEIVQEVFLKLWEMQGDTEKIKDPGKYIYTIARNKAYNYLAKVASDKRLEHQLWLNISAFATSTEEILDAEESQRLIGDALSQMSLQKQTIFRLSREEGLTHEQIAAQTGLSKSRVNNLLVEVMRYIKDFLHSHSPLLSLIFWIDYGYLIFRN